MTNVKEKKAKKDLGSASKTQNIGINSQRVIEDVTTGGELTHELLWDKDGTLQPTSQKGGSQILH